MLISTDKGQCSSLFNVIIVISCVSIHHISFSCLLVAYSKAIYSTREYVFYNTIGSFQESSIHLTDFYNINYIKDTMP